MGVIPGCCKKNASFPFACTSKYKVFCKSWEHITAAEHAFRDIARKVLFSKLDP